MKDWNLVKAAHLATIEGLARLRVKLDFVPSGKFETRRAGRSSGSEAPTSKGRGRGAQRGGSGRSAPTAPTWDRTQTQRWLSGATWASSSWRAASHAMAIVGEQEGEGCALVVPQAQAINFMWLGIMSIAFICVLLVVICFVIGWQCSNQWNDRGATNDVVEPTRPRPRTMRPQGRRNIFTQCDRRSTDLDDINKLTINAIRDELRAFGDSTDGAKVTLAERLQLRRIRNDELAALYANDLEDD